MNNQPIGILDSGVGGLSIWREIVSILPYESTVYIADSTNCPYGTKSSREIYFLAKRLVNFLVQKKVKLVVIACNTITVCCLDKLRKDFKNLPIVGTVPAIKTAVEHSRNRKIGILSTPVTSESKYQKDLIERFAKDCVVINLGIDKLVAFVERGETEGEKVKEVIKEELKQFVEHNVDTIAIGCSHFPFLQKTIGEVMGENVEILDPGKAIARQVKRVLENNNYLSSSNNPSYVFYTTGNTEEFTQVSKRLLGRKISPSINEVHGVSL